MTHENTYRDDISRTLLKKDLLIFVPGPGWQRWIKVETCQKHWVQNQ
jgi:hypothetical protein